MGSGTVCLALGLPLPLFRSLFLCAQSWYWSGKQVAAEPKHKTGFWVKAKRANWQTWDNYSMKPRPETDAAAFASADDSSSSSEGYAKGLSSARQTHAHALTQAYTRLGQVSQRRWAHAEVHQHQQSSASIRAEVEVKHRVSSTLSLCLHFGYAAAQALSLSVSVAICSQHFSTSLSARSLSLGLSCSLRKLWWLQASVVGRRFVFRASVERLFLPLCSAQI